MRDRWYADNRDLVKWASLVHLAQKNRVGTILQVAFYRPDRNEWKLQTPVGRVPFPQPVHAHFRRLEQIEGLAKAAGLQIEVFREALEVNGTLSARERYIRAVVSKLQIFKDRQLILFLDPDTGIAPKRFDWRHVLPAELRLLHDCLKPRDWLVLYQHRYRQQDWLMRSRKKFATSVNVSTGRVQTFSCPELANDVAFFAARKEQ